MFLCDLVEVRWGLAEVCSGDGDCGDGSGLGTEDSGAKGDGLPGVVGEELELFGSPAAFGADGESDGTADFVESELQGGGLFNLTEQDAGGGRLGGESGFEQSGIEDLRNRGAAGLFGGFEGDAAPAVNSFSGGEGEVLFGTASEDRGDALGAELGGFFDGPLEVIELEDGEQEVDRKGSVGFEFLVQGEGDAVGGDGGDFGAVEEAAGDEVVDLTGLGTEDASKVGGLIAGEGGGVLVTVPGVGYEAAAGHEVSLGGWLVLACLWVRRQVQMRGFLAALGMTTKNCASVAALRCHCRVALSLPQCAVAAPQHGGLHVRLRRGFAVGAVIW